MEKTKEGKIKMDVWDWRAVYELLKEGNTNPNMEQINEKRKEITKGHLRRLYYRRKIPTIRVKKSENEEWVEL